MVVMGAETRMVVSRGRWGTWEELILGGAVLRHGTQDWPAVAAELRARALQPCRFTPEACKSKYEDLQQRYAGCTAWFEELRKQRVAELRQELEKSEDLIGSLESKLGSLKADKVDYGRVDCGFSQTEFPVPSVKSAGAESFGKETSKDGLSAGSFTQDTRNWSPEYHIPATASASAAEMDATPDVSEPMEQEKLSSVDKLVQISNEQERTFRKRRGKRKRKDCNRESKEGSIGDSENLGSTNVLTASQCKENSISDSGQTVRSSGVNDHNKGSSGVGNVDLMLIFDSIAKNENALVFRRRLDSQKRARYKKIIRQHLDFDTIRSRIANCSIMSVKELFRDLLLLANNALVFYSRRTREYKAALLLRDHVTNAYQQHYKDSSNKAAPVIFSISSMCNLPVKPRSIRPYKRKLSAHVLSAENVTTGTQQGCKKQSVADSTPLMVSLMMANKGFSRAGKVALTTSNRRPKIPMKERKRPWRR